MDLFLVVVCLAIVGLLVLAGWPRRRSLQAVEARRAARTGPAPAESAPAVGSSRKMETLREAVARLERDGYRESFRAEAEGLRALQSDRLFRPEELVIEEVVRFEGESDPEDQAVLLALRSSDGGVKGSLVTSYGPPADPVSAEQVRRLGDARF